ncbi:MAG TPA: formyltransferase family protein [Candidatus Baltobacteraceae bacterium]|nr:formyltransferase family protein [Candidatus Baltobacteraceae bacterium]
MDEMVNLMVDLRNPQFDGEALARALRGIEAAGFSVERGEPGSDAFLAWIDAEFGGTWSSEAFAGKNIIVRSGDRFAGFVTYDPRGIDFAWLRGLGAQKGVGIFGPFGVAAEFRGTPIGPHLLSGALASLRELGYAQALIPAVGHDKLIAYYEQRSGAKVAERFDKTQWRKRRHRTIVLASGNGTNFQSVIDGVAAGKLPLDVALLVSNKSSAFALERARNSGIPAVAVSWDRKAQSREDYDRALFELVRREQPELLLLLGWMHVLPDRFIAQFPHTINIHPAFLPLDQRKDEVTFPDGSVTPVFRGAYAVRDALQWGSRWAGASAHRVTLEADRGPVLVRKPLALELGDTPERVMERMHPLEHRVLAGSIMRWVYER